MNDRVKSRQRAPSEGTTADGGVFQGGDELGAYEAGVYQALAEADASPIGSPASRSGRSTRRLSRGTSLICGCLAYANSGNSRHHRFAGRRWTLATICGARSTTRAPCPSLLSGQPRVLQAPFHTSVFAATWRSRRAKRLPYWSAADDARSPRRFRPGSIRARPGSRSVPSTFVWAISSISTARSASSPPTM